MARNINPQKIKEALCSIIAFLILLDSMANRLGDIVVRNGKGTATLYLFMWLWALFYALKTEKD